MLFLNLNFIIMNKMMLLFFSIILVGCGAANTDLSGFKAQDYKGGYINRVMIFFSTDDLGMQKTVEDEISSIFVENDYKAIQCLEVFSPLKNYTNDEMLEEIEKKNIDAILFVNLLDVSEEQRYVPETDYWQFGEKTATKTKTGGYYLSLPKVKIVSKLVSTKDKTIIWIGSSTTGGNAYASVNTLARSYGNAVIDNLIYYKLLKNKQ